MARKQGPECPRCACPDTEVIGERVVFGQRRERCECDFCGHVFNGGGLAGTDIAVDDGAETAELGVPSPEQEEPSSVAYNPNPIRCVCPSCQARNPPIMSTQKKDGQVVRHHRCACGKRFKSTEAST